MEDYYMNITSQNNSYDYSNSTYDYPDYSDWYESPWFIMDVVTCVIIGVGLFFTLIAIYALCSQIRNDHVAPIYVINLLISDIIQLCCMIIEVTPTAHGKIKSIAYNIYYSALVASVGFMVCIALERYLVVACPLWYRFRRTIKTSVGVCVLVWVLALVFGIIFYFTYHGFIIFSVVTLLPFPLLLFSLVGVLKSLPATRVPSDEKRRIVAILVLVLLIYTLLFLPTIIFEQILFTRFDFNSNLYKVSFMFLKLSPLADSALYVLMRKGTIDKLLSSVCCCRMGSDDTNSSVQISSV